VYYNLLQEKWIPALWGQGNTTRVGIMDALTQAGKIRQIAASNPMDRVAILRFLLALLYWCKGNPPDAPVPADSFPKEWFTKLEKNKQCFNLLGEGKRFYQYKSSSRNDEKLPANYLIHEVPTGTNVWHFRHSLDGIDGLCRACCALGLLRLPVFTTQGGQSKVRGQGKSPGINARPPVYVVPLGASLAETLRLSWRPESNLGMPAWEKPDLQLPKTGNVPLLTGLTWLPRRVWLENPEEPEAKCISCGRKELLIRQSVYAGRGSTKTEAAGRVWRDPHVIRNRKDMVMAPANALDASDAAAGEWTRITAAVLANPGTSAVPTIWIVGFATNQNKYIEAREDEIPLFPPTSLDRIQNAIAEIENWQKEGSRVTKRIKKALRRAERFQHEAEPKRKQIEVQPLADAIRPHVEASVSGKIGELLAGGQRAWEKAAREYNPLMGAVARSLSPGYTTAALDRRKRIASVRPYVQMKTEQAKKPGPNRGGDE
jgi:CRISPR type I-E-associated protein CasA/Cse1